MSVIVCELKAIIVTAVIKILEVPDPFAYAVDCNVNFKYASLILMYTFHIYTFIFKFTSCSLSISTISAYTIAYYFKL